MKIFQKNSWKNWGAYKENRNPCNFCITHVFHELTENASHMNVYNRITVWDKIAQFESKVKSLAKFLKRNNKPKVIVSLCYPLHLKNEWILEKELYKQ